MTQPKKSFKVYHHTYFSCFTFSVQPCVQDPLWVHRAVNTSQRHCGSQWGKSWQTLLHWWESRNDRFHICGNVGFSLTPVQYNFQKMSIHNNKNSLMMLLLQIPNITEIQPNYGPRVGGTLITVTGPHLDAGKTRRVTLNEVPCPIKRSGIFF